MSLRKRMVIAALATLIVALVGGGIGAGLNSAAQAIAASPAKPPAAARKVTKHSLFGQIVTVRGERLTVRDRTGHLREVRIVKKTVIRRQGKRLGLKALVLGDRVTVVGAPEKDGAIVARLIAVAARPAPKPAARTY